MSRLKIAAAATLALSSAVARAAEVQMPGISIKTEEHMDPLIRGLAYAAVFTVVGLVLFGVAFMLMNKFSPFSIRKEIEEDQNTALAILMGSVILGIAIIVAAAIHG
jgi:putative membrane protein